MNFLSVRDQYLGDYNRDESLPSTIDNYRECISFVAETSSPRVVQIETELSQICPDWNQVKDSPLSWWLCAPKAFRFLERKLADIGEGGGDGAAPNTGIPHFLECRDTYASHESVGQCWRSLCNGLDDWCHARPVQGKVGEAVAVRLGEGTLVKRWLVRLLLRKLRRLEENGEELTRYVSAVGTVTEDGAKPISIGQPRAEGDG